MPFSSYRRGDLGQALLAGPTAVEAGSLQELTLTYVAGRFGLDDSGGIKVSWRSMSDSAIPQFDQPDQPNYCTAEASNGAGLTLTYGRTNIRPWVQTVLVRVTRGFLRPGDCITLRLGDRRRGCPGYRVQTAVERAFPFKVFVDAFATYDFVELAESPLIDLVPGRPARLKAILPTLRPAGAPFRLAVLAEDRWGNVSDQGVGPIGLSPTLPVTGLPATVTLAPGAGPLVLQGLRVDQPGDLWIDLTGPVGQPAGRSNPLRLVTAAAELPYWGDLHGQSAETLGSGTAAEYFAFARDRAFLDIVGHQGNDFQIEDGFWVEINRLAAEYDRPGHMVALPGYEWSGNTAVGGDRNVFFATEGRTIRRSSSVLIDPPADTDCHHVTDLYAALRGEDAVLIPHVGGRYADLGVGHDPHLEPVVEIHSCWGTFEWLLHDALALGRRVGIVCHSDDHKGRPGAAWPGAARFGALGGLTCYPLAHLDRASVFDALRRRRTYGTTGTRLVLDVTARLPEGSVAFDGDPALGPAAAQPAERVGMGAIARAAAPEVALAIDVLAAAPVERVTVFNGPHPVAVLRPHSGAGGPGRRLRVLFEGAEYRGRGRETFWRGTARLLGNRFTEARAINHFNADRPLGIASTGDQIAFDTVTTGNFSGFDLWLEDAVGGALDFATTQGNFRFDIAGISSEDTVVDLGGLGRRIRLFRLSDRLPLGAVALEHPVALSPAVDNPIYVRVTLEDGHQAWSSPIYLIP